MGVKRVNRWEDGSGVLGPPGPGVEYGWNMVSLGTAVLLPFSGAVAFLTIWGRWGIVTTFVAGPTGFVATGRGVGLRVHARRIKRGVGPFTPRGENNGPDNRSKAF